MRNPLIIISFIIAAAIFSIGAAMVPPADEFGDLFARIEKLNIGRNGYTLGKVLTEQQKETARRNAVADAGPGTYKFKDKDLYVVTDPATDRVIILYEHYEPISGIKVRELVGALFFEFEDPTVMAHDKTIYWAYNETGKISQKEYRRAKDIGKPLDVLAFIKLNSSIKIMDDSQDVKDGSVYYIISSDPMLKRIKTRGE